MEDSVNSINQKHKADCLKIFHLNVESFNTNAGKVAAYLKCLNFEYDIIYLAEIRVKIQVYYILWLFLIIMYALTASPKKGGIAILFKKNKFKNMYVLDINANFYIKNQCRCSNCKIKNKWLNFNINNLNVIIGVVYRHPKGNINHFNTALNNIISQINDNTLAIFLGDININLLSDANEKVNDYLINFLSNNFIPCITLFTRIRNHSVSLIDHIFIKNTK